jgi:phytol kinase
MLGNNLLAFAVTLILSLLWLRLMDILAHRGVISSKVSRKIIHVGTGPIFVLCWLLFVNTFPARFYAAVIPLVITAQFVLVGLGFINDPAAVAAMSRSGNRREILKGPLFYGIVFVILTIVFWYESPVGIIALMILCGGDGLADIVGMRFGKVKLPWSKKKSWAGTAAVLVGGIIFSLAVLSVYLAAGKFPGLLIDYVPAVVIISFVCSLVESIPISNIDNITVPITAVILGLVMLG